MDSNSRVSCHPLGGTVGSVGSIYGLIAEYGSATELLRAARMVREAGYMQWDTYTRFPVQGIESAMGIRQTRLPWIVLGTGICSGFFAVILQWYANAHDYRWVVSGKPFSSVPAVVPVAFELTVCACVVSAFAAMLWLNGLPCLAHPLLQSSVFRRVTNDRFCLAVEACDPRFRIDDTQTLLNATGAVSVQVVENDQSRQTFPKVVVYGFSLMAAMAAIPIIIVAMARGTHSRQTRYHVIADMDHQPKSKVGSGNSCFADGRASRAPVDGVVAHGELREDTHRYEGKLAGAYATGIPNVLVNDNAWPARGRERFGVYCVPCHGSSGKGDGLVSKRALVLSEGAWAPPANLLDGRIHNQPEGQIFESLTQGLRNMPAFGSEVPPDDRWAIILHLRVLARKGDALRVGVPSNL